MTLSLYDNSMILDMAIEAGYDLIRCSLTGAVVAQADSAAMEKAIDYLRYTNPMIDDESILDQLEMRWMIQSSRPSVHLLAFANYESYRWLYDNHPRDLLAILMSRVLFEHSKTEREIQTSAFLSARMSWLIQLQASDDFINWTPTAQEILDRLVQIDAIHNIRHALRGQELKDDAKNVRTMDSIDFGTLLILVNKIESAGLKYLSRAQYAPAGNRQSLSAALGSQGLPPEELVRKEEEELRQIEARRRAIAAVGAANSARNGKVIVNRGAKAVIGLQEVGAVIPPKLAEKYAKQLEKAAGKKPESKSDPKTGKKLSKAAAKFAAFTATLDAMSDLN